MDVQDIRSTILQIAEETAPGWERRRADVEKAAAPVREWLLRELGPRPGDTVLELAAGAGDTGFEAAGIVGERGRLISTDFSPAMLDVARRRGAELGIGNVEYRVMDAEHIDLDADSVDGVLCRFGYMLMADPAAALADARRVLRPGGRLTLAVWGAPERNPFFSVLGMNLVQRGHMPPPQPGPGGVFSMANAEHTTALLRAAGFGAVRTDEVPLRFAVPDLDEYLSLVGDTSGPLALVLRGLPEDERESVKLQLQTAFAPFVTEGGYEVTGVALCTVAG